jgi:hypothetical protein
MFDLTDHLDGLRCRETHWLLAHREELVREQRRLRVEELAVTAVLDERGAFDEALACRDGVSARTVRETVETARALESLPEIAAAAHAGDLSSEQLAPVTVLADESTDAEWAHRARNTAPAELARMVRTLEKPTVEDSFARRQARSLRMWRAPDTNMLSVRGELPDLDGARFEATINRMIDGMRPPKGQPWDTREHRGADALMQLCDLHDAGIEPPVMAPTPLLVAEVPLSGPALVAGVPLPDAMVEKLRANASIEPVLVDDTGIPIAIGSRSPGLSPKLARAIRLRDQRCRCGNCDRRHGLQIHHLRPRSWGGTDDPANLALVCTGGGTDHHAMLVPHGPWALVGNPNRPDGLRLVHLDQLTHEQAEQLGLPPPDIEPNRRPRAGPR